MTNIYLDLIAAEIEALEKEAGVFGQAKDIISNKAARSHVTGEVANSVKGLANKVNAVIGDKASTIYGGVKAEAGRLATNVKNSKTIYNVSGAKGVASAIGGNRIVQGVAGATAAAGVGAALYRNHMRKQAAKDNTGKLTPEGRRKAMAANRKAAESGPTLKGRVAGAAEGAKQTAKSVADKVSGAAKDVVSDAKNLRGVHRMSKEYSASPVRQTLSVLGKNKAVRLGAGAVAAGGAAAALASRKKKK